MTSIYSRNEIFMPECYLTGALELYGGCCAAGSCEALKYTVRV